VSAPLRHYVAVYCDHPGCWHEGRADVLGSPTVDDAYAVLRADLADRLGWVCDTSGDWCPLHPPPGPVLSDAARSVTDDTPTP
jgi:hypothetical protein